MEKHESEIARFVKGNLAELRQIPTLFLDVSLSEVTVEDANAPSESRAKAHADTDFRPELRWIEK